MNRSGPQHNDSRQYGELFQSMAKSSYVLRDTAAYKPLNVADVVNAAPVTEVLMLFVASDTPEVGIVDLEEKCVRLSQSSLNQKNGVRAVTYAWLLDEIPHGASPTGMAKVLKFLLAWDSLEDHQAAMATEQFRQSYNDIKGKCLPFPEERRVFHAKFVKSEV